MCKQQWLPIKLQLLYAARMNPIELAAQTAGGQSALAKAIGVQQQLVWAWINRGGKPPSDRCPDIERATDGRVPCEVLRPDVHWVRIADAAWPHPAGRPLIDAAAPEQQEAA